MEEQWQRKLSCISSENNRVERSNEMGILEDQRHQLDVDSLYSTNPEIRAAAIRRLSAGEGGALQQSARRAEREALAERTKWLWGKENPSFAIEANFQVMGRYDGYDLAFRACRNQLAERVLEAPEPTADEKLTAHNERLKAMSVDELRRELKADIKRKLATPEYGSYGQSYVPNFSAKEFKQFPPTRVKEILQYPGSTQERPGVRAGIDKLLRDAQLKNATK
jgi:hypothetical protein